MSSDDSDSDVCDFMTNTASKLGKDKFWTKFKLSEDNDVENVEKVSNRTQRIENRKRRNQNAPDPPPNDLLDNVVNIESQDSVVPEKSVVLEDVESQAVESPKVTLKVDAFASINIENRLETLSKKVKEILQASSKPARGGRRGRRGRINQIALPYTRLVTAVPELENDQMTFSPPCLSSASGPIREKRHTRRAKTRSQKSRITEIVLSSDDEATKEVVLHKPPEALNPIVSVKVLWRSVNTHTFQIKKFQCFKVIKDYYVKEKQANPKLLYFTLNNKEIDLESSSVVTLRLKENDIIEGSTLSENYLEGRPNIYLTEVGHLKLKVQFNARRSNAFTVSCRKTDKMEIIFWQVMQEIEEPIEYLKLYFDGALLNPGQEISALDLEDGDCFDLVILKD